MWTTQARGCLHFPFYWFVIFWFYLFEDPKTDIFSSKLHQSKTVLRAVAVVKACYDCGRVESTADNKAIYEVRVK